ncbi:MAG: preprotein translocase subunit YajC [Clostridiales bacterium]|nr:preprotein translocase subunit YajC [Clostridiales bacterium]MBQ2817177.1 preprotein translocase subunit YajC [Clostridia bacterium]
MSQELATILIQVVPFVAIIVLFYFILIRPQQKKDKAVKEMLAALKTGDRITTIGGIFGKVVELKDDVVTIEVGADKTKLVLARWAIRSVDEVNAENDLI